MPNPISKSAREYRINRRLEDGGKRTKRYQMNTMFSKRRFGGSEVTDAVRHETPEIETVITP